VFILIPARQAASVECTYYRWVKYLIFWPSIGGGAISAVSLIVLVGFAKKKSYSAKYGSNSMPRAVVESLLEAIYSQGLKLATPLGVTT